MSFIEFVAKLGVLFCVALLNTPRREPATFEGADSGRHRGRQSFLRLRLNPDAELSGTGVMVFLGKLAI